jgi:hypothetical protein
MQVIVDRLKLQVQVICCWHKHLLTPLYVIDSYDKTELCVSLYSEFENNICEFDYPLLDWKMQWNFIVGTG